MAEIGAWLDRGATGRGLVTNAVRHMIDWAFTERGLHRIEWHCTPANAPSIAVAKRLGMTREGVLRQAFNTHGRLEDLEIWALVASDSARGPAAARSPRQIAAHYFEMWNTGDSSIADEILCSDWLDHAHPEVTGPDDVRQSVEKTRLAQPDLRFQIDAILGDGGDLVAVAGAAVRGQSDPAATRLLWLIRLKDGQMAEMWTYRGAGN